MLANKHKHGRQRGAGRGSRAQTSRLLCSTVSLLPPRAVSFFIGLGLIFVIVLDSQYGQEAFMSVTAHQMAGTHWCSALLLLVCAHTGFSFLPACCWCCCLLCVVFVPHASLMLVGFLYPIAISFTVGIAKVGRRRAHARSGVGLGPYVRALVSLTPIHRGRRQPADTSFFLFRVVAPAFLCVCSGTTTSGSSAISSCGPTSVRRQRAHHWHDQFVAPDG